MSTYPSPASGPVPFAQTVAEIPLPVALERLFRSRATGTLTLDSRQGRHTVYLREGYPVSVDLPGSFELLGKVLVEMKILDEVTYRETLATPPPDGVRYGELLLSKKLVTEDQLRQALKAQVRRKLHRLFFLTDSSIEYAALDHQEGKQGSDSLRVHPWRANYHGVRSAWNADRLRQALAPLAGRPLHTTFTPEELARFGLGAEDGKISQRLREGTHTIDTLSLDTGLPTQPVSALIYSLFVAAGLDSGSVSVPLQPAPPPYIAPPPRPTPPAPAVASAAAMEHERIVTARGATIDGEDLFAVLGVARSATTDQIKTAYLEAARRFHPDRLAALGLERLRAAVEAIFRRVSEAQSILLDDARRVQYLKSLDKPNDAEAQALDQARAILQAELNFTRGQHLLKKNELSSALRDFEAALAINPKEGEHIIYVAWTRRCMDTLPIADAKAEVQRGLKLSPKCAAGQYFLGMLLKDEGLDDQALVAFRKAAELDTRAFDAEQEIHLLETRRSRGTPKRGILHRLLKPGK